MRFIFWLSKTQRGNAKPSGGAPKRKPRAGAEGDSLPFLFFVIGEIARGSLIDWPCLASRRRCS
jgi:hypothetical protein